MASIVKSLRALSDPTRLRLLLLLVEEELTVAELQEILGMGQSRISMQLSQLKQVGLVDVRKVGQKSLYRLDPGRGNEAVVTETLHRSGSEIPAAAQDDAGLPHAAERDCDPPAVTAPTRASDVRGGRGR